LQTHRQTTLWGNVKQKRAPNVKLPNNPPFKHFNCQQLAGCLLPISPSISVLLFMNFIQGKPRNQQEMYCQDAHVDADNEAHLIHLFVESINLSELGFKVAKPKPV